MTTLRLSHDGQKLTAPYKSPIPFRVPYATAWRPWKVRHAWRVGELLHGDRSARRARLTSMLDVSAPKLLESPVVIIL